MSSEPVVKLTDVSYCYGSQSVLEDICFEAGANELICIVGPNGGGKTTLVKLITGLLRPDRGQVRVFGCPPHQVREKIGYMPQNPHHDLSFPVSVMDVVLMGRLGKHFWGSYGDKDKHMAKWALGEVDMDGFEKRSFAALSGGQRQRVLIARALSTDPELLVLDEPAANVDPEQERHLHGILRRLKERMTILMVTHDFVPEIVEEVVCVNRNIQIHPTSRPETDGRIEVHGEPMRIVRHDRRV